MGTGSNGRERIRSAGVTLAQDEKVHVTAVRFGSPARKLGVSAGYTIEELKLPNPRRPAPYWGFIPAIVVALAVWLWQGRRVRRPAPHPALAPEGRGRSR
jgi:hypothetical protein